MNFDKNSFCLNHVVLFRTNDVYKNHMRTCEKQSKPYTCNLLLDDGTMCAAENNGGTTLYVHCLSEHGTHICTDCDFLTRDLDEFEKHVHFAKNGRQSK